MTTPTSTGPLLPPELIDEAEPISRLHATNPFEPAWLDLHRAALGQHHVPGDEASLTLAGARSMNRERIAEIVGHLIAHANLRLAAGGAGTPREIAVYQGCVVYSLWDHYGPHLQQLIDENAVDAPFYDEFAQIHRRYLVFPGSTAPDPAHLLALLYNARRAWYFPRILILGTSPSAAAVRAALVRASMGRDICAYAEGFYRRIGEIPVLITGETGTGKDRAAQCIGWSRYIPFDVRARKFVMSYRADYHVRNVCEASPSLLESALFGHKRGAFTGATADAVGFFGLPGVWGTLLLDEAGELPREAQAKLLRPLQNRGYVPLGGIELEEILCRIVFATNCDLEAMAREGTFRADLLERMNGVRIHMPPLRQMLAEKPEDLGMYVQAFVAALYTDPERIHMWTERVMASIRYNLARYPWPRNLRELNNHTRRVVLGDDEPPVVVGPPPGQTFAPAAPIPPPAAAAAAPASTCVPSSGILGPKAKAGEVTLEQLNRSFVKRMHALCDENASETARRVGIDRRTVKRLLSDKDDKDKE